MPILAYLVREESHTWHIGQIFFGGEVLLSSKTLLYCLLRFQNFLKFRCERASEKYFDFPITWHAKMHMLCSSDFNTKSQISIMHCGHDDVV